MTKQSKTSSILTGRNSLSFEYGVCALASSVVVFGVFSVPSAVADESGSVPTTFPVQPEEEKEVPFVRATRQYRHRMWAEAAEDFGAALPTEFNNPLLHYYYANCMVHLKHRDAAIREYRIAYALQPVGTIGNYCKMCLDKFGIDAEGKKSSAPKTPAKVDTKKPAIEVPEPPGASELAALKVYPKDGSDIAIEREKSVQNLRDLMQQKKRANGAPLPTAEGTNFYVRSYKGTPGAQTPPAAQILTGAKTQPGSVAPPAFTGSKPAAAAQTPAPAKKKWGLWWW